MECVSVQAEYKRIQEVEPGQVNLKHMLERDTFAVIGMTTDPSGLYGDCYLAISAYFDKIRKNERVDTMFFVGAGTHFGVKLAEGVFRLVVFADMNNTHIFEPTEVAGTQEILVNRETTPQRVLEKVEITLHELRYFHGYEKIVAPEKPVLATFPYLLQNFEQQSGTLPL